MIHIEEKKKCAGCCACYQICPRSCIAMEEDNEGFSYPKVNLDECIDCGLCVKVCPVIYQEAEREPIKVYAAKNLDDDIRKQSSSGGVFSLFAEEIISRGGVVFGALFNSKWEVVHDYVDTIGDLNRLRGSKYVQSKIGESFKNAEQFLKEDRLVLFSGTPCQIAGLNRYLRREYDKLICLDIVCHGVPSPMVWSKYLSERLNKIKISDIKNIEFRNKEKSWRRYHFSINLIETSNIASINELASNNLFMKGFLKDLYLRPSCFYCPAKKGKSTSDVTLGDYWGIENVLPDFSDDEGVSLVIINSNKGEGIFNELKLCCIKTSYKSAINGNPCITESVRESKKRELFYKKIKTKTVLDTILVLTKMPIKKRIKKRFKFIFKKIGL